MDEEVIEATAIAIPDRPGILPVDTPEQAKDAWRQYRAIQAAIMTEADYQNYQGVKRPNKSFVKKVQRHYQLSVSIARCDRQDLGGDDYGYLVIARATAPNGYYVEASGGCSTTEKRFGSPDAKKRAFHDIIGTAETRATNRAVLNLIGGGVVSAEEADKNPPPAPAAPKPPAKDEHQRAREAVMALCTKHGVTETQRHELSEQLFGKRSTNSLTVPQLRELYGTIQQRLREERSP